MNFWRFFSFRTHTLRHASVLLAITALFSNILGLGRNLVYYRLLTPDSLDVYRASFWLADLIFNILIVGAITSAVVPVITEQLDQHKEKNAWDIINQLFTWTTIILVGIGAILSISMDAIIRPEVSGFHNPAKIEMTVTLSRIMLLQSLFFSWSYIIGSLLNGYKRFGAYSLAPLLYNLALIIGGLLTPKYGLSVLVWSVVIGAILHFLLQYREALITGFRVRPDFRLSAPVQEIFHLLIPRSLSQGMGQIVFSAYLHLISFLREGSLAVYTGINDLQTTPTVIVANSVATAFFPTLRNYINLEQFDKLNQLLTRVIRITLFLLIPFVTLSLVLRAQIIRLYVGIGGFGWQLTEIGIHTFAWFMVGVIPAALVALLARVFYAHKDTRTPLIISVIAGGAAIFVGYLGIVIYHGDVSVIAMAEVVLSVIQCVTYLIMLHRRGYLTLHFRSILSSIGNYCGGALLLGFLSWVTLQGMDAFYLKIHLLSTNQIPGLLLQGAISAIVGLLAYFGYSTYKMKEELTWIRTLISTRKL